MEIIGTYIDRAYSARTDNRPEFKRMIKGNYRKQFEVVFVWKLDRFAKLDVSSLEGRRKLIDGFINSVYLYDDKIVINFNGTREARTVSMEEIESSGSAEKPPPTERNRKSGSFFVAVPAEKGTCAGVSDSD